MTWRSAFYGQAADDFRRYFEFNRRGEVPVCQELHYLQMAAEKLAKAFLSPVGAGPPPPAIHAALVRFLKLSKGQPDIRNRLGYAGNYAAYCAWIDSLMDIAEQVEKLAPAVAAGGPNAEYPWRLASGAIVAPVDFAFPDLKTGDLIKFHKMLSEFFRIFPSV